MKAVVLLTLLVATSCAYKDSPDESRAALPSLIGELASDGTSPEERELIDLQIQFLSAMATKNLGRIAAFVATTFTLNVYDVRNPLPMQPGGWPRHSAVNYWQIIGGEFTPPEIHIGRTEIAIPPNRSARLITKDPAERAQVIVNWQRTQDGWRAVSAFYQYVDPDPGGRRAR